MQGDNGVRHTGGSAQYLLAASVLCIFPLLLVLFGNVLLGMIPQVQEFLRAFRLDATGGTAGPKFYSTSSFLVLEASLLGWSLSVWYTARLLLGYEYPGGLISPILLRRDDPGINSMREWYPRVQGFLATGLIPLWYLRSVGYEASLANALMAFRFLLPSLLFTCAVLWRRRAIRARVQRGLLRPGEKGFLFPELSPVTKRILAVVLLLSFGLLVGFYLVPDPLGLALGAPAILFLAMTSWVLFGGIVLTLVPKSYGWPSLFVVPILLAVFSAPWNDNHRLREVGDGVPSNLSRPTIGARFEAWREARMSSHPGGTDLPVFVVASAGGGIRAAYWTASVLARVDADTKGWFGCHVFALSGVSGGALGVAAFVAGMAERGAGCDAPADAESTYGKLQRFLGRDYLSPVIGSMLFPDMVQRLIPWPRLPHDRAWAMETSWELGWEHAFGPGPNPFSGRFLDLYASDGARAQLPSLFLNSTSVDQGKRVVQSNIVLPPDSQPIDGFDLMQPGIDTRNMPLSTAVDNSARFPYVAPAGTVAFVSPKAPQGFQVWGRVVDGGYFDNSGATTAREVVEDLRGPGVATANGLHVVGVQITNSGEDAPLCVDGRIKGLAPDPTAENRVPALSEVTAPIAGLVNSREGRSSFSQLQLIHALDPSGTGCRDFFAIAPNENSDQDPPLGWYLSARTRAEWEPKIRIAAATFEGQLCSSLGSVPGAKCP